MGLQQVGVRLNTLVDSKLDRQTDRQEPLGAVSFTPALCSEAFVQMHTKKTCLGQI